MNLAATEADIVGNLAPSLKTGLALETGANIAQSVSWLRDAAGDRFGDIELESAPEEVASRWGVTAEHVLASPYFLLGSVTGIVEQGQAQRERHGISYLTVFPECSEAIAPVVNKPSL